MSNLARSLAAAFALTAAFAFASAEARGEPSQLAATGYTASQVVPDLSTLHGSLDPLTEKAVSVTITKIPALPAAPGVYVQWTGTDWRSTTSNIKLRTKIVGAGWVPAFAVPSGSKLPDGMYGIAIEVTGLPGKAPVTTSVTVVVKNLK